MAERKQGHLAGTLAAALNPLLRNIQSDSTALQLPELALRCAQFFHSLSQYCLTYYRNDTKQKELLKTKNIRKEQKEAKEKVQRGRRKKEAERDENAPPLQPPRKPLTAYIIYFQDKKHHFVERYPSLNLSELTKLIAKEWKEISDKERQVFLDRAADDRRRYEEQMQEFKRTYGRAGRFPDEDDSPQDPQPAIDEEAPLGPEDLPEDDIIPEQQASVEAGEAEQAEEGSQQGESENNDSSDSVQVVQKEKQE